MSSPTPEDTNIVLKEEAIEDITPWKPLRNSAFSPYRPVTILTNLQRGNIETTQTVHLLPDEYTFHRKAAMGEITASDFIPDTNIDEIDNHCLTPLMWAAFYGQLPTVRLLLQKNVKVDAEGENGETALLLASSNGHHEVCHLLLGYGADPNHVDHFGNTSLIYAAYSDSAHSISELLDNGADITATNAHGASAFSIAINKGCKKAQIVMEKYLLRLLEPS